MANTDFSILLNAIINKSGITTELKQVQQIVNKYSIDIMPELKTASLKNQMKSVSKDIANDFNKAFGTNLTGNDVFKAFESQVKQATKSINDQKKAIEEAKKAQEQYNAKVKEGKALASKQANDASLAKQKSLYDEIASNQKQVYSLKQKIISADTIETQELNEQINVLEKRNKYINYKTDKAGLSSSSYEKELSISKQIYENQLKIKQASVVDKSINSENKKNTEELKKQGQQLEKNRQLALEYTKAAQKQLDTAVSKYSYGDSTSANNLSKQLGSGVLNFKDINKVNAEIDNYKVKVEGVIKTLEQSHKTNLNGINDEINKTVQLEKQKDSFHKNDLNDIDLEIKKREEQSKIFSNQIKAQMQERIDAENKVQADIKNTAKVSKDALNLKSGNTQLDNNISSYLKNNSKLSIDLKNKLIDIQSQLKSVDKVRFDRLQKEFRETTSAANALGQTGDTAFIKLKKNSLQFLNYLGSATIIMSAINGIKNIVSEVKNIDTSMINLKKVTNETNSTYESFLTNTAQKAKELGASISDLVESTADFARLGYNLPDAAKLSEVATLYKNVGDGISIGDATQSIISTMKAFNLEAESSITIIDKFNQVGNSFAISSSGIGTALQKSASALASANNTLDESIALITAGNNVIQDPDSVGTALKTLSLRIRGTSVDIEAMGEDADGAAETVSKLRDTLLALTKNKVDIQIDEDTYASTYDIMLKMSKVWKDMTDLEQASALELMFGKRQANIGASILTNMTDAENALTTSLESSGSALREQQKYTEGIQYSIDRLSASMQEMSNTTLDSSTIKFFVDFANGVLNATTAVGGLVPVVGLLGSAFAIHKFLIPILVKEMSALAVAEGFTESTTMSMIIKQHGLNGAFALGSAAVKSFIASMAPILGFAAVIAGVVVACDLLNVSLKEQQEITENLNKEYDDIQSKLSEVNTELETTATRMDELNSKENLTFVEKQELENLKETNVQLESQNRLLEEQATIKNQAIADSVAKEFKIDLQDNTNEKTYQTGNTKQYAAGGEVVTSNEYINSSEEDYAKNMIVLMDKLNAKKERGNKLTDEEQLLYEDIRKDLVDTAIKYNEYADKYKIDDETSQGWRDFATLIDKTLNPAEYDTKIFDEIFNSDSFAKAKAELEELAKSGLVSGTVIESNKEYKKLIEETGLSADSVAEQINAMYYLAEEGSTTSVTALKSYKDIIDGLSKNIKMVTEAQYELSESGYLNYDTVSDLLEVYPDLESSLTATENGYKVNKGALDDLINSEITKYELDLNNAMTAGEEILGAQALEAGAYDGTKESLINLTKARIADLQAQINAYNFMKSQTLGGLYITPKFITDAQNQIDDLNSSINSIGNADTNFNNAKTIASQIKVDTNASLTNSNTDKADETDPAWLTKYNSDKADLDDKLAMDKITQADYYKQFNELNEAGFGKHKDEYLEQYRQNKQDIYKGQKQIDEDSIKSKFDSIDYQKELGYEVDKKGNITSEEYSDEQYWTDKLALAEEYYTKDGKVLDEYADEYRDIIAGNLQFEKEQTEKTLKDTEEKRAASIDKIIDKYSNLRDTINKTAEGQTGDAQVDTYSDGIKSANQAIKYIQTEINKLNKKKITVTFTQDDYDSQLSTLQSALSEAYSSIDDFNKSISESVQNSLDELSDTFDKAYEKDQEYLEDQKDNYSDIIDAQKEILQLKKEQNDYEKDIADKTKDISSIESRMAELSKAASTGDRQANAELQKLQEDLADKKEDLSDTQADRDYDLANDALDKANKDNDKIADAKLESLKEEYKTQKTNQEELFKQLIALTTNAKDYTITAYSEAIDAIASKFAQSGIVLGDDYTNGLKTAQEQPNNNANAVYSVLNRANGKGGGTSDLNDYVQSQNFHQLSYANMAELASIFGISGVTAENIKGDSATKQIILQELKKILGGSTFVDGGIMKKAVTSLGETGIGLFQNGEALLSKIDTKLIKDFTSTLKLQNNLVKFDAPNMSNLITNRNNSSSPVITINLPASTTIDNNAINNYRKLIPELTNAVSEQLMNISRQYK